MDAQFKWLKIKTLDGFAIINIETVSHVMRVGIGYGLRMTSGYLHLMTKKDGDQIIKHIIGKIKI